MLIAQYTHRLPADYDLGIIRDRARARGPLWDALPELHFKAFLLRTAGQHGAGTGANAYASLYLWRQDAAFRDFLVEGRYQGVIDSFGRADIHTRVALDARRGPTAQARFAWIEDVALDPDADLAATLAREIARNREAAGAAGIVAATVGIDARDWTLRRVLLSEHAPASAPASTVYEVLHLARPLLDALPGAGQA